MWLGEAIESVAQQSRLSDCLLIVDDMHGRDLEDIVAEHKGDLLVEIYQPPWRLGVATAFNTGCAVAVRRNCDLMLMLGADDRLERRVVEELDAAYEHEGGRDGYYFCDVIYDDGTKQSLPCNDAVMTTGFMRETGGLPVDASSGAMDTALISALLTHRKGLLIHVHGREARFWSRHHPHQESARLNRYFAAHAIIRDAFTAHYAAPAWGRFV